MAAYASALDRIVAFLGRDAATLPPLRVRLLDVPSEEAPALLPLSAPVGAQVIAPTGGEVGLEASVLVTAESPGPLPELVLTPLVLEALFGPAHPLGQFWTDGLAGYLAAQGGSADHAEAPPRALKLHEEGQLPGLSDQIQRRA